MEVLIVVFILLFLVGAFSFLKPTKKMKALSGIRLEAQKEGFKIGSTPQLRKKFKNWTPQVAIYQLRNNSTYKNLHYIKHENGLHLYDPLHLNMIKNLLKLKKKYLICQSLYLKLFFISPI